MPFNGSGFLALSFLSRLFVELTTAKLGQHARFFTGTLETAQGGVEILVFFYANTRHRGFNLFCKYKETRHRAGAELRIISAESPNCKARKHRFTLRTRTEARQPGAAT